jgi:nicotinate dehydrogenase subunit B
LETRAGKGGTLSTGSEKPHFARDGVARVLGLPQDKVHGIWVPGPGSYGRNDAGDAGIDAAVLSKAVGRPMRVQGMRYEGQGWDPKGPASIHRARAALDKDGAVIGYVLESKGFSRVDIDTPGRGCHCEKRSDEAISGFHPPEVCNMNLAIFGS